MKKPIVSIVRNDNIGQAVKSCLDKLELPDLTGKTILLKPNVGREVNPNLAVNTNPEVVRAIFEYLNDRFDARFLIGDSPIINSETKKAFIQSGYEGLLNLDGLQFIDLDERPPIELEIPDGRILKKIKVTGYWDEIDSIISIPCLKMHMHTGASLSFKNLKGLIYKREKVTLHHLQAPELISKLDIKNVKELEVAIADLANIFHPELAIIDASFAQEGMGPSSGDVVKLDTIIASTNYLAADIIALALTQPNWSLENVPHLKIISETIPESPKSREDIETIPENIQDFITQLEPPPKSISIKYKNVNLLDVESCSACLSTIFNLLKNNEELLDTIYTNRKPLNLAIGKGLKQSDLYTDSFLIGNCSYNNDVKGTFIKGCAPVESIIMNIIKEKVNESILKGKLTLRCPICNKKESRYSLSADEFKCRYCGSIYDRKRVLKKKRKPLNCPNCKSKKIVFNHIKGHYRCKSCGTEYSGNGMIIVRREKRTCSICKSSRMVEYRISRNDYFCRYCRNQVL